MMYRSPKLPRWLLERMLLILSSSERRWLLSRALGGSNVHRVMYRSHFWHRVASLETPTLRSRLPKEQRMRLIYYACGGCVERVAVATARWKLLVLHFQWCAARCMHGIKLLPQHCLLLVLLLLLLGHSTLDGRLLMLL